MTLQQAREYFGNYAKVARAAGVTRSAVSLWLKTGEIPEERQVTLMRKSNGRLRADSKILSKYREVLRAA